MLLGHHEDTIHRIQALVGVPPTHWVSLYKEAIRAYAGYVQELPPSEAHHHDCAGRLEHGLTVALHALTLRQGTLLPTDADAETLIEKQDVWTYALFCAALLHDADRPACDQDGKRGPPETVTPHPAHAIVPVIGLQWLAQDPRVFRAWSQALSGQSFGAEGIGPLIMEADRRAAEILNGRTPAPLRSGSDPDTAPPVVDVVVVQSETSLSEPERSIVNAVPIAPFSFSRPSTLQEEPSRSSPQTSAVSQENEKNEENPGVVFLDWLREGLRQQLFPINVKTARIHVTEEGLLLASPAIFRDFDQNNWARVQRRFTRLRLHEKNKKNHTNIHTYVTQKSGRKSAFKGYLIANVTDLFGDLPLPPPNTHLARKS